MDARLRDVAELAGVSIRTVSNVVRDYPHVSPKMRAHVQAAIDELGYIPNTTARRLATGRTGMIALALPTLEVPYFAELSEALSEFADEHDYKVLIQQTSAGPEAERQAIVGRERGLVDGVILQPTQLRSSEISLLRGDLPLVLLGELVPPLGVDHVMIDNLEASNLATKHLIATGRRRIAFLGHERSYRSNTYDRRQIGYQSALEEGGLPIDAGLLIAAADFGARAGDDAITAALASGADFDAVVCYDDLTAVGALRALHRAGIAIPDQVAVVGWDNISIAEFVQPPLTTIAPDRTALVRRAVEMLIERIEGHTGPGRHELVSFDLLVRESTVSQ